MTEQAKATVYQVVGWNENFEGAKSRTYSNKSACQMPTKHGIGYRKLVRSKNGAALFGAWCAMIQVLSRHQKPRDGYCTDTGRIQGRPYTDTDLELLTDIPADIFRQLFQVAARQDVGWLRIPQGYHADTTRIPQGQLDLDSDSDSDSDSNLDSDCDSRDAHENESIRAWFKMLVNTGKFPALTYECLLSSYRGHESINEQDWRDIIAEAKSMPGLIGSPGAWLRRKMQERSKLYVEPKSRVETESSRQLREMREKAEAAARARKAANQ